MPNGFTAACVSSEGLVVSLGYTLPALVSETATGIMIIPNSDDLIKRTLARYPEGPTGAWKDEWWAVWNYLQYGAGAVLVGGTGSVWGITLDRGYGYGTPIHTTTEPFNVVFGLDDNTTKIQDGNKSTCQMAIDIALKRQNVFAIVGSNNAYRYDFTTGDTHPWAEPGLPSYSEASRFAVDGFTFGMMSGFGLLKSWGNYTNLEGTTQSAILTVLGRKNYIRSWSNPGYDKNEIAVSSLGPDMAGCFGRAVRDNYSWSTPAGIVRGRLLNVIKLEYDYTADQRKNAEKVGINSPQTFPGKGFFFMSNTTLAKPSSVLAKMDFQAVINHIRQTIKDVGYNFLFEVNNKTNRDAFTTYANRVLAGISSAGAIGSYNVQCDGLNNTDGSATLNARILIQPLDKIRTVQILAAVSPDGVSVSETLEV